MVADYGRGTYVYCGYSLYRQLPAGVQGPFRLFANLLAPGGSPLGAGRVHEGDGAPRLAARFAAGDAGQDRI